MEFHTLLVKDIQRETPLAVSIEFEVPEHLKEAYQFKAGQYITIKTKIKGEEIRRSYSLSSSPNSGRWIIAVKAIPNGTFSTYANEELKVGDALEVATPEGLFVVENADSQNIVLVAAGSGITPTISILKDQLENKPNAKVVLIYGNKTINDTIYYQQLQDLQQQYADRLHIYYTFSKSTETGALFGRIERSTINFVLLNKHIDTTFDDYFLCGPKEMITQISEVLEENGIDLSTIHYELFTSDADNAEKPVEGGDTVKVTAIIDDETHTIEIPRTTNILSGLLKNDIDAPYSCQGGICSSCMCKVTEGTADMKVNHILMDDEIEEGYILSCQSYVTSDEITIDFDDV